MQGSPTTIESRQQELEEFHATIFGEDEHQTTQVISRTQPDDDELVRRMFASRKGQHIRELWDGKLDSNKEPGDEPGNGGDLALCSYLAFWTARDAGRIDRLFRMSARMRPKWDSPRPAGTYGSQTIAKAIQATREVYTRGGRVDPSKEQQGEWEGGLGRSDSLPRIVTTNRHLHEVSDEALAALQAANRPPRLFVRSGELVRIVVDEDQEPVISLVGEACLRGHMDRAARFVRVSKVSAKDSDSADESRDSRTDPPLPVVRDILSLGAWPFPPLIGIVEVPTIRPNGSILSQPGYDRGTRLVYAPAPDLSIPAIPEEPTQADADESRCVVWDCMDEFPFADEASATNTLALLLTPIVRPAIRGCVPLALLDAPQAGTGKTLISEVASLIGTGRDAALMTAPKDDDEWRKQITSVLVKGATCIVIDNIDLPLEAPSLARTLTATTIEDRILGRSEMMTLRNRTTWVATGNNIALRGDLPRRCYWIRLDAKQARPWQRDEFKHKELKAYATRTGGTSWPHCSLWPVRGSPLRNRRRQCQRWGDSKTGRALSAAFCGSQVLRVTWRIWTRFTAGPMRRGPSGPASSGHGTSCLETVPSL